MAVGTSTLFSANKADINLTDLAGATVTLTVTSVVPAFGPAEGGTAVTITGTGFDPAATAALGGVALTDLVVVSSMSMTGVTPAGMVGIQTLQVENPGPVFSDPVNFCYTGESEGWRLVRSFPGAFAVLVSADGNSILVPWFNEDDGGIYLYKSTDRGATFSETVVPGIPWEQNFEHRYFASDDLSLLLFPNELTSLLSTDGGASFTVVEHAAPLNCRYAIGSSNGQFLLLLLVDPLFVLGSMLQMSSDSGSTWTSVDVDSDILPGFHLQAGDISDDGQKILLVGLDGEGVSQATSTDGGTTWVVTPGLPYDFASVRRVDMTRDGSIVFASGYTCIYRSDDFGETWVLSPNLGLLAIAYDAGTQAYVVGGE